MGFRRQGRWWRRQRRWQWQWWGEIDEVRGD